MIEGAALLAASACREIGAGGIREIRIEVFTPGSPPIRYQILHAWTVKQDQCRSLFCLTSPRTMAGTNVLMVESRNKLETEIWLRLRTARTPVRVCDTYAKDFVLGTDFTYEDLRFWLPTDDYAVGVTRRLVEGNGNIFHIELVRHSDPDKNLLEIELDVEELFTTRMRWMNRKSEVEKLLDAGPYQKVNGAWVPTVKSVTRPGAGYSSTMTLLRMCSTSTFPADLFNASALVDVDAATLQLLASQRPVEFQAAQ